jgi:hypothetical protein
MKPSCAIVTALLLSSGSPLQLYADTWGPPILKAALSPSGRFEARTSVGEPASLALWDRGSRKRIYETKLVNPMSPLGVFVADTGEVLTVDDHGGAGQAHAVVLYDQAGHVIRDYGLESILSAQELRDKIDHSVLSIWWRYPTESPWADRDSFHITTIFGAEVLVSLKDGGLRRGPEPFSRLQSHLKTARACVHPEIRVVHVTKEHEKYRALTCALVPLKGSCHEGATGFGELRKGRTFPIDSLLLDQLFDSAGSLLPWIERNWAVKWGPDLIQVEMSFACSQAVPDEYRFVVDRCALKDPKAAAVLDEFLSVANLSDLVDCPGHRP